MVDYKKYSEFIDKKEKGSWFFQEVPLSMCDKKINVLCGVNGSGKSMSLRMFQEYFEKHNIKYLIYRGHIDGVGERWANVLNNDRDSSYAQGILSKLSSEGEERKMMFDLWQKKILLPQINNIEYVLLDEVDSGLSPDRIWNSLGGLTQKVKETPHLKWIITANQYEMIECLRSKDTKIIWIPTLEEWNPQSYEEFKKPYYFYIQEIYKRGNS